MNTTLNDRVLWFDGSVTVEPSKLMALILKGKFTGNLHTTEITKEIIDYNRLVNSNSKISIKCNNNELKNNWNLSDEYKKININDYVLDKLNDEALIYHLCDDDVRLRVARIIQELQIYTQLHLIDLLKTLIYIIDVFNRDNVVWGVGRGSSVSSYVLYLIGVHDIDSVLYDLNFNDFLTGE